MGPGDTRRTIRLRGVRTHNLKGIDLDLPHGRLIVFTGVSGSGKSSLAFDTLYAEGQRRYIETFSPYTRQFLEALDKPDADGIDGLPPAIAVGQREGSRRSGRTTVATVTEIQEHLALAFARRGTVFCRGCGTPIRPSDPDRVVQAIDALADRARYQVAFPVTMTSESDPAAMADELRREGFVRARIEGEMVALDDPVALPPSPDGVTWEVVVDRLVHGAEDRGRLADSIETAFARGLGRCLLITDDRTLRFDRGWSCPSCGTEHLAPVPALFRPGSPLGACPTCEGFGQVAELRINRAVPDPSKSIRQGAIAPWSTPAYRDRLDDLLAAAPKVGLPVDLPFKTLTPEQVSLVREGGPGFIGLDEFLRLLERKAYKMHVRVFLSRWRGYRACPSCLGARLRPEALAVKLGGKNVAEVLALTVSDAVLYARELGDDPDPVVKRPVREMHRRLDVLARIGLGYLTLDRLARTLSGGENRRVALASALGSGLINTLYVLDEPTEGLHPADVAPLVAALADLRDAGNTVAVVEHDPAVIEAADLVVDIGPGAGTRGGRLLHVGPPGQLADCDESLTGAYLSGRRHLPIARSRRAPTRGHVELLGARGHNLQSIDVSFPLGVFCVVTGVSGTGKSTLVEHTLHPALARRLNSEALLTEPFRELKGASPLADVAMLDASPIGRSARSNPITYLKAYDEVRRTFASTHEAKLRNLGPGAFSFNVEGGRCSSCQGTGAQVIDLQFLPDVLVTCPECQGRRFRPEVLEVTYRGKTIADVLDLTAREAFAFFRNRQKIQHMVRPLLDVGLDYLRLGQPASTLSGGESQRLKLAAFLGGAARSLGRTADAPKTMFLMDEPTTGLHPADVAVLLDALNRLVDLGHSLVVVEHSVAIMACADWIIDLGPGPGADGGRVVARGTPEEVARADTPTGRELARFLATLD